MKKIVTSLYLLCCVCMCQLHAANNVVDSPLSQLDHVIQNRPVYIEQKEKKLNDLRQALRQRISDENRFTLLGNIWMNTVPTTPTLCSTSHARDTV